jgi:hypothetical protein
MGDSLSRRSLYTLQIVGNSGYSLLRGGFGNSAGIRSVMVSRTVTKVIPITIAMRRNEAPVVQWYELEDERKSWMANERIPRLIKVRRDPRTIDGIYKLKPSYQARVIKNSPPPRVPCPPPCQHSHTVRL